MLSVLRRTPRAFISSALTNSSRRTPTSRREFSSKPKVVANKYTAAVLEEFDKPLVMAKMKNDTPLGTDMVSDKYNIEMV